MLREVLMALKNGDRLALDTAKNQYGETVVVDALYFEEGQWIRGQLNCWSSRDFGFGTCQCFSHDPWVKYPISRKEALQHIRSYLERQEQEEKARQAEIEWLDKTIAELAS